MSHWNRPLDTRERMALRDCIQDGSHRSASVVEDIIRLAIASASCTLHARVRKPEVDVSRTAQRATPAFEQRLVALFSE